MKNIRLTVEMDSGIYSHLAALAGRAHLTPGELLELQAAKLAARDLSTQPYGSQPGDLEGNVTLTSDRKYFVDAARQIEQEANQAETDEPTRRMAAEVLQAYDSLGHRRNKPRGKRLTTK